MFEKVQKEKKEKQNLQYFQFHYTTKKILPDLTLFYTPYIGIFSRHDMSAKNDCTVGPQSLCNRSFWLGFLFCIFSLLCRVFSGRKDFCHRTESDLFLFSSWKMCYFSLFFGDINED